MASKSKTIDTYLAALSADKRAALEKLRKAIRKLKNASATRFPLTVRTGCWWASAQPQIIAHFTL